MRETSTILVTIRYTHVQFGEDFDWYILYHIASFIVSKSIGYMCVHNLLSVLYVAMAALSLSLRVFRGYNKQATDGEIPQE